MFVGFFDKIIVVYFIYGKRTYITEEIKEEEVCFASGRTDAELGIIKRRETIEQNQFVSIAGGGKYVSESSTGDTNARLFCKCIF